MVGCHLPRRKCLNSLPKNKAYRSEQSLLFLYLLSLELVLKVRVANSSETDFIEIELDRNERTLSNLVLTCCRELNCEPQSIIKLRKLPNTIIRKDKDVWRLTDFQELELVLQKFTGNTRIQDAFQTLIY